MASARIQNLSQYVGEDKVYQDTIFQADGVTPQNILGWTIQFTVHAYGDPRAIYIQKTAAVQGDGTAGICQATVNQADTQNADGSYLVPPGEYEHRWERIDASFDGVPTKGLFTILAK